MLEKITKISLIIALAVPPFLKVNYLIFPFISGKVYFFRLMVAISFAFWVALMMKNREYRPNFKNPLIAATLLFLVGLTVTSFLGVDLIYSLFSGFERADGTIQFAFFFVYFLMLVSVFKTEKERQLLILIFLSVALLVSLYSWLNFQGYSTRLHGIFGNPSYLAAFLLFAIGFAAILLEKKAIFSIEKKIWFLEIRDLLWLSLILFFVITLIFTQTRGAYAGLGAGIVLAAILSILFLRKEKKQLVIILSSVLVVGLIFATSLFIFKDSQFVKNQYLLSRLTDVMKIWENVSAKERLLTWNIATKAFKEKPIFGWGPENFGTAFNKYYDYRIGLNEPWFDRVHNQFLQILPDGGIFLFFFYVLWVFSIFYLIFKIFKQKKILAIILSSTYFSFLVQGLFLFDTLPLYFGFFPFLAILCSEYQSIYGSGARSEKNNGINQSNRLLNNFILTAAIIFSLFLIYATVWIPYKGNVLTFKFYAFIETKKPQQAFPFMTQSAEIKSPYVFFESRKRNGWQFLSVLDRIDQTIKKEDAEALIKIYKFITPELEKAADYRPTDPQIYFVLGRAYRVGYEKLGQNDLAKGENILKRSLSFSNLRVEYINELAQILILQGKFNEVENLIKDYAKNINPEEPFPYAIMGHLYFLEKKYDLAMIEYEKAIERGYQFWGNPVEYSRYLFVAEQLKDYQKIIDMSQALLENRGPNADAYFNLAVGYLNLKEDEKAKEFFYRALELDKDFQKYKEFFDKL